MSHAQPYIPWKFRAFLSIDETGVIFSRSADWVREQIVCGRLQPFHLPNGGALVVSVDSVAELVDRILTPVNETRAAPVRPRRYPRLVWSNPQP